MEAEKELINSRAHLAKRESELEEAYQRRGVNFSLAEIVNCKNRIKAAEEEVKFRKEVKDLMDSEIKGLFN